MTPINKIKQEILVWSVVVGVFVVLTLIAINFDNVRKLPLFNNDSTDGRSSQVNNAPLHQPGESVVLAQ